MLKHFSLYGFLKNQRYFEPFFVLYLLQLGVDFTAIGILIAIREIVLNMIEVPSGAMADIYGRRRCMMASFIAYMVSFIAFALAQEYWHCVLAIIPYAIGDAFRTGTHKAMIFTWLEQREQREREEQGGQEGERGKIGGKQRVYGYTRSWSKIGSAVSIPIAVMVLLLTDDYRMLFWAALIPYTLALVNFFFYSQLVDGARQNNVRLGAVMRKSLHTCKQCIVFKPLRQLMCESMAFEGVFKASKDYIQPLLAQLAMGVSFPFVFAYSESVRSSVLIGVIYVLMHLCSALASRQSHRVTEYAASELVASRWLWVLNIILYTAMGFCLWWNYYALAVVCFMGVHIAQSLWRPLLVSRIDALSEQQLGATVLSVESQARSLACIILAPLLGVSIDYAGELWPLALIALVPAVIILCVLHTRTAHACITAQSDRAS